MKLALLATLGMVASTLTANAETFRVNAEVTNVTPNMVSVERPVPVERCNVVRVPITETRRSGGNGGDALAGMIIGGLIGKGATGTKDGAQVGAVIGGIIGAEGRSYQVVTGYRNERQCNIVNEYTTQTTRDGSIVTYSWNGLVGTLHSYGNYNVGDEIIVSVTIN